MSSLTPFESLEHRESENVSHIIEVLRRKQEKDYQPGNTRRDAHPKHTGLVEATFTLEEGLPSALRVGVFAEVRSFSAWVRFSNAGGKPQSDAVKDVRGCAIKLLDVPGTKLPESDEAATQDFLLINTPTMPLGTLKLFHDAICLSTEWSPLLFAAKMIVTGRAGMLKEMNAARIAPASPADIRYWSTTPYLFGKDCVAKYSLAPTTPYQSKMPSEPGESYLSEALEQHLNRNEATFDFLLQLNTDRNAMPVEDSSIEWPEAKAPFVKVATLRIPMQKFRTEERNALSESLAFSPTHALVEHRPIGAINRGRMRIYNEQAIFRQKRDQRSRA